MCLQPAHHLYMPVAPNLFRFKASSPTSLKLTNLRTTVVLPESTSTGCHCCHHCLQVILPHVPHAQQNRKSYSSPSPLKFSREPTAGQEPTCVAAFWPCMASAKKRAAWGEVGFSCIPLFPGEAWGGLDWDGCEGVRETRGKVPEFPVWKILVLLMEKIPSGVGPTELTSGVPGPSRLGDGAPKAVFLATAMGSKDKDGSQQRAEKPETFPAVSSLQAAQENWVGTHDQRDRRITLQTRASRNWATD